MGDIYYSDGAISHQEDDLLKSTSERFPIGIVGYTTMKEDGNYWTEKDTKEKKIGGHALVMCLKTIGSTGSTKAAQEDYKINKNDGDKVKAYIGSLYHWYKWNIDTGSNPYVDSKSSLINSYKQSYGSGYKDTNYLIGQWGSDAAAAYWAKKYNTLPANSSKCTGWFLPSAGQYYAVMKTLGAPLEDWTGIWDGNTTTHKNNGFFSNMTTVTKNINDKLMKVGDLNYTEFFGVINTWAWTSSIFFSKHAVDLDSGINDGNVSGSVRFDGNYYYKASPMPVRPFLAF